MKKLIGGMHVYLARAGRRLRSTTASAWRDGAEGHRHGRVSRPPAVPRRRPKFNEAVALLHSFWFAESRAIFESVLKDDPNCAIAYWGIALTHWGNPFAGQRAPQTIANGKAAIDKGLATGSPTPREKGYIDAVAILFSSSDVTTQRQRVARLREGDGTLSVANKADVEARIFWALSVAQAASPTDKTYARNLQAAEMLEPMFKQMPKHPGIAHYIIHAYDVPLAGAEGAAAARSYADIAPVVPHALHMPSHTFTRVGYWKESVDTNIKSADDRREDQRHRRGDARARLHDLCLPADGHGFAGQGRTSTTWRRLRRRWAAARRARRGAGPNTFALAAIPARYAMERQQWAEAAALDAAAGAEHALHRGDHALRARRWRRPRGQAGRRRRRHRRSSPRFATARSR